MPVDRTPEKPKQPAPFDGFGIALEERHTARIERIVDAYEAQIVSHLEEDYQHTTRWSDRIADHMAAFGGSWPFIILFALFLAGWMVLNTLILTGPARFDGPPFILLNLVLSFTAAFQAPIIMMSQNRQAARDKREAIIDFAVNYKAEAEVDDMQQHLHAIEARLDRMERMLMLAGRSDVADLAPTVDTVAGTTEGQA